MDINVITFEKSDVTIYTCDVYYCKNILQRKPSLIIILAQKNVLDTKKKLSF